MSDPDFWPQLIRDLCKKYRVSERQLALKAGVNRCTLRRVKAGKSQLMVRDLEAILHVLQHEIEVFPKGRR